MPPDRSVAGPAALDGVRDRILAVDAQIHGLITQRQALVDEYERVRFALMGQPGTAAAPAVGSATSRSIDTTCTTSGIDSRPARPTTSTGTPRAVNASAIGPASALRRTSTAALGGSSPACAAAS